MSRFLFASVVALVLLGVQLPFVFAADVPSIDVLLQYVSVSRGGGAAVPVESGVNSRSNGSGGSMRVDTMAAYEVNVGESFDVVFDSAYFRSVSPYNFTCSVSNNVVGTTAFPFSMANDVKPDCDRFTLRWPVIDSQFNNTEIKFSYTLVSKSGPVFREKFQLYLRIGNPLVVTHVQAVTIQPASSSGLSVSTPPVSVRDRLAQRMVARQSVDVLKSLRNSVKRLWGQVNIAISSHQVTGGLSEQLKQFRLEIDGIKQGVDVMTEEQLKAALARLQEIKAKVTRPSGFGL